MYFFPIVVTANVASDPVTSSSSSQLEKPTAHQLSRIVSHMKNCPNAMAGARRIAEK